MTLEEYKAQISAIEKEANDKKLEIGKKYVLANNPYQVGDIIEDRGGNILKIERIMIYLKNTPCCKYYGIELTKRLFPKKNQTFNAIFQSNVIRKIEQK